MLPAAAVGGGLALAPLLALSALIAASWRLPRSLPLAAALALAAATWAALSLAWSPAPRPEQALKIITVAAFGLVFVAAAAGLSQDAKPRARAFLVASMLVLAGLLSIEALAEMPLNRAVQPEAEPGALMRNPGRGVFVLTALGPAALGALLGYSRLILWGAGAPLIAAMAWLAFQFGMEANAAALAAGLLAFGLGYAAPRWAPLLVGVALGGWMLAAPWVMLASARAAEALVSVVPMSWGMRLQIWSFTAERIREKPFLGWGLDASRVVEQQQTLNGYEYSAIPLHPHSLSLQVWFETGVVGAVLVAAAMVVSGNLAGRLFVNERAAAAASAAAMAVIGLTWNLSYGAWQEWLMALPFVAAASVLLLRRAAPERQ
jgi:O-antigen ligase